MRRCLPSFRQQQAKGWVTGSCLPYWERLKIAPTVALSVIVTEHVAEVGGVQLADHPTRVDPGAATAVRLTCVPSTKFAVQPAPEPQSIPAGVLVTVPVP